MRHRQSDSGERRRRYLSRRGEQQLAANCREELPVDGDLQVGGVSLEVVFLGSTSLPDIWDLHHYLTCQRGYFCDVPNWRSVTD
ncbi:hypothetical protein LSAT2_003373 [Lamellibrachia satsuma]|nr:hypothetical protein LSAT2_003373 [Lamellibrachia satsuma]